MRVALVHDWLIGMRGGEKVLEALLELWPEADIYTLFYDPRSVSEAIRLRRVQSSFLDRMPGARARHRRLLPLYPWAMTSFRLDGYDLVISVSHCAAKAARASSPFRHLCYCLTPMRYLWTHYDDYFGAGRAGWATRAAMAALRGPLRQWDATTCNRVGRFLAISQNVSERIRSIYAREAAVLHPPVETEFFTPGADSGEYFLVVSALVPYKRVDLAIEACGNAGVPLKVVGTGPCEAELRAIAGPGVEFLGWVAAEKLRDLYRGCQALLFPADEDFGIAPVEAQACGRPVVAFRGGGALETVVEGETGVFFDRQSAVSLQGAIQAFQAAKFDPSKARSNALPFSRDRFLAKFQQEAQRFLEADFDAVK